MLESFAKRLQPSLQTPKIVAEPRTVKADGMISSLQCTRSLHEFRLVVLVGRALFNHRRFEKHYPVVANSVPDSGGDACVVWRTAHKLQGARCSDRE